MPKAVRVLPLLLHASVFLFFAGLVLFLFPINVVVAGITLALVCIVGLLYIVLTFLSIYSEDCPYETPLSP